MEIEDKEDFTEEIKDFGEVKSYYIDKVLKKINEKILDNPKSNRLEILDASRIVAYICHVVIPQGLAQNLKTPPVILPDVQKAFYETYDELVRDRDRGKLLTRRRYLSMKLGKVKSKAILVHPDVVRSWKEELVRLERQFKKKIKKEKPTDEAIRRATEESSRKMAELLSGAGLQMGDE